MFEFGREFRRLFCVDGSRDGLTTGDAALLELLDLALLRSEARAADIAAGRISAKDPAQRRLEAARVWRELARRTGDALALRSATLAAERAAHGFKAQKRVRAWGAARCEQALSAILGAELFGDEDLNAVAEAALRDTVAAAGASMAAVLAQGRLARLSARKALNAGSYEAVLKAAARFDGPINGLEARLRLRPAGKALMAELRCDRAELLIAGGARLRDPRLYERALAEMDELAERLDAAYEPLSWARAQELRGAARVTRGEMNGSVEDIADGVDIFIDALETIGPDHSPLDWGRLQYAMGLALMKLGETSEADRAFVQALGCFDRAILVSRAQPALTLRAMAAKNRAVCLARRAEMAADPGLIDGAVTALKVELVKLSPRRDPVGWAIAQVNLAQLYMARLRLPGGNDKLRAAAAMALDSALEIFTEQGLRALADQTSQTLAQLAAKARAKESGL